MTETHQGCDTNYSAIEDAVGQLMRLAQSAAFGFIVVDCNHVKNHAINIRTLNHQHRRRGTYQPAADDGILALADAIGHILNDPIFSHSAGAIYVARMRDEVNHIRQAVAMRMQANRRPVVDFSTHTKRRTA